MTSYPISQTPNHIKRKQTKDNSPWAAGEGDSILPKVAAKSGRYREKLGEAMALLTAPSSATVFSTNSPFFFAGGQTSSPTRGEDNPVFFDFVRKDESGTSESSCWEGVGAQVKEAAAPTVTSATSIKGTMTSVTPGVGAGGSETTKATAGTSTGGTGLAGTVALATACSSGGTTGEGTTTVVAGTKNTHSCCLDASENLSGGNTGMEKAYLCKVLSATA